MQLQSYADVAQLVEQRIRNAQVGGSSPLVGLYFFVVKVKSRTSFPNRRCSAFYFNSQLLERNISSAKDSLQSKDKKYATIQSIIL